MANHVPSPLPFSLFYVCRTSFQLKRWPRFATWSARSATSWPTRTAWTPRRSRRPSTNCSSPLSSSSRLPTRRWRPTETVAHPLPRRLRQIPARRRRSSKADERLRDDRTFQKVPSESHLGRKSCLKSSTFKKKDSFRKISSDLLQTKKLFWRRTKEFNFFVLFWRLPLFCLNEGPSQVTRFCRSCISLCPSFFLLLAAPSLNSGHCRDLCRYVFNTA